MKKTKSHMSWSWSLMVLFFILSIVDIRFGVLGLLCMGVPLYHAVRKRGKIHCAKYCPRGSFLGKFMQNITMDQALPKWINTDKFKHGVLIFMLVAFGFSLTNAGMDLTKIAIAVFRFLFASSLIAILMGVFFKPRSWCQICPMGHATGLIRKSQDNTKNIKNKKDAA